MAFSKAVRRAAPLMVELSGVSGSGKTTSGLLLAAGMIGLKGRVGLLDTENGRGSLMADEDIITKALPGGYEYDELFAPYTPERCVAKIQEAEKEGIDVLLFDSATQEYAGMGGVSDIAETHPKGWAQAKLMHKRFMNSCLSSKMDIIFCFRAQPKVKIEGRGRDQKFIDMGIMSIQEKNWAFDMTVRWHIEEATHKATLLKAPRSLEDMKITDRLLNRRDGELLREWKLRGALLDPMELIQKRARSAAELGTKDYLEFFEALTKEEKKSLVSSTHASNKDIAAQVDATAREVVERDAEIARANAEPNRPETVSVQNTPQPDTATTQSESKPTAEIKDKKAKPAPTDPTATEALPWMNEDDMKNIFRVQQFRVGPKAYSDALDKVGATVGDLKWTGGQSVLFYKALKALPDEAEAPPAQASLTDDSF